MKHDYCVACGNTENLHQHHLTPKSLNGLSDNVNMITLCNDCHANIHGLEKKFSTSELTKRGIDKKRNNELIAVCGLLLLFCSNYKKQPSFDEINKELQGVKISKTAFKRALDIASNDINYFVEIVFFWKIDEHSN